MLSNFNFRLGFILKKILRKHISELYDHSKILIKPAASLSFPASDSLQVEKHLDQITIIVNFLGLYGVDSPLPQYFNYEALKEDAASLRSFLDIFNHRFYVLYLLAQYDPESLTKFQSSCDFLKNKYNNNKQSLLDTLEKALSPLHYSYKFLSGFITIANIPPLGSSLILNKNSLVGSRIYKARVSLQITIYLTLKQKSDLKLALLKKTLQQKILLPVRFDLRIQHFKDKLLLNEAILGHRPWLGRSLVPSDNY